MSRTSSATASAMERGGGAETNEGGNDDGDEAGTRALLTSGRSDGGTHRRGGSASNLTASSAMEPADVDYMEHARTIDKRYLTPLFTLQEGDRDGVN